jgi:putative two-component system response regulator
MIAPGEASAPASSGNGRIRVLAVDDQPENLELLAAILEEEAIEVDQAADGLEALAAVERRLPHAILLDVMMPRLDGFEVCRRLKGRRPSCFVPVILLTALADTESKVRGLESGADDFLNKPFHRSELLTRLRSLLKIRALRDELDSTESVIFSMIELLEGKETRTRHHSLRVAALAAATARRLELDPRRRQDLVWGALLHDLGKLGVPESVLLRSEAERSADERALYESHPELGRRILGPIASLRRAAEIVAAHHERRDGAGYPNRLASSELPLGTEIVAAANRLDHLRLATPDRPDEWAKELRSASRAGEFRADYVEAVLHAVNEIAPEPPLDEILPVPVPEPGGTILVADDSATNRMLYRELLEEAGFRVITVADGEEALAARRSETPDLMILDVRMPKIAGDEVCRRVKSEPDSAFLPVVLVTAYDERASRAKAIEARADDLLISPVQRAELLARVRSLLRLRVYHDDLVRHENVVLSLSAALEAKDPYTRGHSQRVGELSARLALELGETAEIADRLRLGGLLHDIGKVAIPEALLHKPGRLEKHEFAKIMEHPVIGWEICRRLRSAAPVLDVIRYHHERFDGGGYPDGLAGEAIPWHARVLAVADALDALTSERPYRERMTIAAALALLAEETRQGKWDPRVFAALRAVDERGAADLRLESRAAGAAATA